MSTGTGGTGAGGAPSGTDPQPPCSLHSCLDSVQLRTQTIRCVSQEMAVYLFYIQSDNSYFYTVMYNKGK